MPINSISPATFLPPANTVQPVQPITDDQGNSITINQRNKIQGNGGGNILLANIIDIQGSNNNITINQYNDIIINTAGEGSSHGGIMPVTNQDGSVSFKKLDGGAATLQEYIAELLQSLVDGLMPVNDTSKQAAAYDVASALHELGGLVDENV